MGVDEGGRYPGDDDAGCGGHLQHHTVDDAHGDFDHRRNDDDLERSYDHNGADAHHDG